MSVFNMKRAPTQSRRPFVMWAKATEGLHLVLGASFGRIIPRATLVAIRNRLDPGRHGMTEKNRSTLRWFEDDALVAKLLALPETIARRHRNKAAFNVSAAVEMQIALAIELLTVAPVRCDNLHAIHLERNLVRVGSHKDPQADLYFPPTL